MTNPFDQKELRDLHWLFRLYREQVEGLPPLEAKMHLHEQVQIEVLGSRRNRRQHYDAILTKLVRVLPEDLKTLLTAADQAVALVG